MDSGRKLWVYHRIALAGLRYGLFPGLSCGGLPGRHPGTAWKGPGGYALGRGEQEEDADFLAFIRAYPIQSRPKVLELLARYSEKETHIFRDRSEADAFLEML